MQNTFWISENLLAMPRHCDSSSPACASEGHAHLRWNWGHNVGANAAAGGNNGPSCFAGS